MATVMVGKTVNGLDVDELTDVMHVVRIKGFASAEQFQELHEAVARLSPSYINLTRPVKVQAHLVVE